MIKVEYGDLIRLAMKGQFDLIGHGCNCFCNMDMGLAYLIKEAFPEAYEVDRETGNGDIAKLGCCSMAKHISTSGQLFVVNGYTQFDYDGSGILVDYDAVRSCMKWIKREGSGLRIGLPKIGAGLAKGCWDKLYEIIHQELSAEDLTLVYRNKQ